MTLYTEEQVTEALEAVVKEKGEDYVYPNAGGACWYAEPAYPTVPSCIVGHVVARLDPDAFRMLALSERENHESFAAWAVPENTDDEFYVPNPVLGALVDAQAAQDGGLSWGEVLNQYHLSLELRRDNDYEEGDY